MLQLISIAEQQLLNVVMDTDVFASSLRAQLSVGIGKRI